MIQKKSYNLLILLVLIVIAVPLYGQYGAGVKIGINTSAQYSPAAPGQQLFLAIQLDLPASGHLYANPRQGDLGIDTEVKPSAPGVKFGKPVYPVGKRYVDKLLNASNHIYEGKVTIYLPLEVPVDARDSLKIDLAFNGLYCTDDGSCIPWETNSQYELKIATESVASEDALFKNLDLSLVEWLEPEKPAKTVESVQPETSDTSESTETTVPSVAIPDYQPVEFSGMTMTGFKAILLAFIAGLILNIMPCVLPVIPLKVLSIIQQAQSGDGTGDKFKSLKLSLVFSIGIILVFVILAAVMSGFKLFYGQQFQSDVFKFIMLGIIFILTLSMMGLFEIVLPAKMTNVGIVKQGYAGSLGMGIMATLLATPCSAPLLGPVLVWSLSRPTPVTIGVFLMVGVGMAAPYVLLTAFPRLLNRIPKAGTWMIRLKEGLSFVMLGVCIYLISLFPPAWFVPLTVYCVVVAFAIWLGLKAVDFNTPAVRRGMTRLIALAVIGYATWLFWQHKPQTTSTDIGDVPVAEQSVNWLVAELLPLHDAAQTVMVEFTADWCPNCKAVELAVLKRDEFKAKLDETNTKLIIADLTRDDPAIKELLTRLGSQSIPFTAIFPGNDPLRPIVLRDVYTLNMAVKALDMAAAK